MVIGAALLGVIIVIGVAIFGLIGLSFFASNTSRQRSSQLERYNQYTNSPATPETRVANSGYTEPIDFGSLQKSCAYGGESERFEICIFNSGVWSNDISIYLREKSLNYRGYWMPWKDVISKTYITDDAGNSYLCTVSESGIAKNGPVKPGEDRGAWILFRYSIPPNISKVTLHFAYRPDDVPITLTSPVIKDGPRKSTK